MHANSGSRENAVQINLKTFRSPAAPGTRQGWSSSPSTRSALGLTGLARGDACAQRSTPCAGCAPTLLPLRVATAWERPKQRHRLRDLARGLDCGSGVRSTPDPFRAIPPRWLVVGQGLRSRDSWVCFRTVRPTVAGCCRSCTRFGSTMTKKNAASAPLGRARKFGGAGGSAARLEQRTRPGPANRKLTMGRRSRLREEKAPAAVRQSAGLFGSTPYVYVVGDASEPLRADHRGGDTGEGRGHQACTRCQGDPGGGGASAHENGNLPFGGLLTVDDLGKLLNASSGPEQVQTVVTLLARFSTPPPAGQVHVFAVAAGEVLASLARVGSDDMTPRQRAYEEAAVGPAPARRQRGRRRRLHRRRRV